MKSPPYLCVSLTAKSISSLIESLQLALHSGADIAEIRLDLLQDPILPSPQAFFDAQIAPVLNSRPLPVIVTNRAKWEGGLSNLQETDRLSWLIQAATKCRVEHIDVEVAAAKHFGQLYAKEISKSETKLILSTHNFQRAMTKEEIADFYAQALQYNADVFKIAMAADSILTNLLVMSTISNATIPTITIAMGEAGMMSRVCFPGKLGGYLTFSALSPQEATAPGQVDVTTMLNLYRFRSISPKTKVYGVIGNPISHSMSPAIHNASFAKCGIDAVYLPFLVQDAPLFISNFKHFFSGLSITIPHKETSMKSIDQIDPIAENIGAINTVVVQPDGFLFACNTDWIAAISAVEDGLIQANLAVATSPSTPLQGKSVLLLGAGGAARGLAFGAVEKNVSRLVIVNRSLSRAQALADELHTRDIFKDKKTVIDVYSIEDYCTNHDSRSIDVVMNSTSIGMHPQDAETPLPATHLHSKMLVFDAIYNPLETRLLKEAKMAGCICVGGVEMFVRQAARQFELWTKQQAPIDIMRGEVLKRLKH